MRFLGWTASMLTRLIRNDRHSVYGITIIATLKKMMMKWAICDNHRCSPEGTRSSVSRFAYICHSIRGTLRKPTSLRLFSKFPHQGTNPSGGILLLYDLYTYLQLIKKKLPLFFSIVFFIRRQIHTSFILLFHSSVVRA